MNITKEQADKVIAALEMPRDPTGELAAAAEIMRGLAEDAEPVPGESLDDLLGRYWDLAYAEGHSRGEESYGNAANAVLHKIRALYTSPQAAQTDEREAFEAEFDQLCKDYSIYGTMDARLCKVFFEAGRAERKG